METVSDGPCGLDGDKGERMQMTRMVMLSLGRSMEEAMFWKVDYVALMYFRQMPGERKEFLRWTGLSLTDLSGKSWRCTICTESCGVVERATGG